MKLNRNRSKIATKEDKNAQNYDEINKVDLVNSITDLKSVDKYGRSVLHQFAMIHNINNLKILFEKIPKHDIQDYATSTDYYGNSALVL